MCTVNALALELFGRDADGGGFEAAAGVGLDGEVDGRADGDGAGAVGDARAVERVVGGVGLAADHTQADEVVELDDGPAHGQWTIFEIGSSMIPVAPASLS